MSSPDPCQDDYHQALSKLNSLKQEFNSLRIKKAKVLNLDNDQDMFSAEVFANPSGAKDFAQFSGLLDQITDCEVEVSRLKQEGLRHNLSDGSHSRSRSFPSPSQGRANSPFGGITHAQTDSALDEATRNPAFRDRLREWLLQLFNNGAIERLLYHNILKAMGLQYSGQESVVDCAEQYWPFVPTDPSPASVEERAQTGSWISQRHENASGCMREEDSPRVGSEMQYIPPLREDSYASSLMSSVPREDIDDPIAIVPGKHIFFTASFC
jgi:hypothetical protein